MNKEIQQADEAVLQEIGGLIQHNIHHIFDHTNELNRKLLDGDFEGAALLVAEIKRRINRVRLHTKAADMRLKRRPNA